MEKLIPGYHLSVLQTADSTNSECRRLAENGGADGTIIQALSQSSGRGRRGRTWTSPEGNLYFSMIVRPECTVGKGLGLSFVTAVAMCNALGSIVAPMTEVLVKWPNDILLNHRKVCGFLLESHSDDKGNLQWIIIGCGVNVKSFPQNVEFPATSLEFEGSAVELRELLLVFVRQFKRWRDIWENEGFPPIRSEWLIHGAGVGKKVIARLSNGSITGKFIDINYEGSLIIEKDDGEIITITSGDIFPEMAP